MIWSITDRRIVGAARAVVVRPLTARDAEHAVDTVFASLSPQSRYLRSTPPRPV